MAMLLSETVVDVPQIHTGKKIREVVLLIILAAVQFSFLMDYILLMPLGPQLMKELKINPTSFGYLISIYTFSAAIAGLVGSFYIDRFDRKNVLLFVYSGFCLGPILCALSPNFMVLMIARIFTGAFGGVLTSVIMTILGDSIPTERLGRATSFVIAANGAASVIGVPAGLALAAHWGWQAPFYILGIVAMFVLLSVYIVLPQMNEHLGNNREKKSGMANIHAVIKNPDFIWPIVFMSLLTFAGGFTILPFLSTYLASNMSFSTHDISFLFFLGGAASFIAGPVVGTLTDKFGKQNVFLLLNFLSMIPILLVTIYPLDTKWFALTATTLFFMLSTGRHVSGMALINSRFNRDQRGQFLSVNSSIQMLAGTCGTIISGYILFTDEGMLMNFDVLGIIAICATILCIFTAFVLDE